ncbi:MAG TPA: aldo/keto reductase [Armatimonadota bacterium]|nr:aldo/keto reductase [Armatimonadota bacterium]
MEYRSLGDSGLRVSEVMLGTWAIGGNQWGPADDAESVVTIKRAIDLGITAIDTAPGYGYGHAEELVGQAIKGYPRESVVIATKTGLAWDETRPFFIDNGREHVLREIENSLRRLQTDYVDLLQIHWPDRDTPVEETLEAMIELQQAGKVRHIGVSNFNVPLLERSIRAAKIASLQPGYNLFERHIEAEILPFCKSHNIGIIAYGPLAKGLLTGKFNGDETFPDNDIRRWDQHFQGSHFKENVAKVERLRAIAEKYRKTPGQLAIGWILEHPGISAAIAGARRPSQVEDNAGASGWHIAPEDMTEIERIFV